VIDRKLEREQIHLQGILEHLNALNPLAVLQRGYAAVKDEGGALITSSRQLREGQNVTLMLRDGTAQAEIKTVKKTRKTKRTESQNGEKGESR
jgi:exodeoxyribonuclease VII large subunit